MITASFTSSPSGDITGLFPLPPTTFHARLTHLFIPDNSAACPSASPYSNSRVGQSTEPYNREKFLVMGKEVAKERIYPKFHFFRKKQDEWLRNEITLWPSLSHTHTHVHIKQHRKKEVGWGWEGSSDNDLQFGLVLIKKKKWLCSGLVVQGLDPSTWEAEAGGSLSLRPAWSTQWVPGEPVLYRETPSQNKIRLAVLRGWWLLEHKVSIPNQAHTLSMSFFYWVVSGLHRLFKK